MEEYTNLFENVPQELPKPAEKPAVTYSAPERIAAAAALVLGFLFVRLVWYRTNGLATTLFYWVLFTAEILFIKKSGIKLSRKDKQLAGVLYIFPLVYTVTASAFLRGLTTIYLLLGGCLFLFSVGNPGISLMRFLPLALGKAVVPNSIANYGKTFGALASQKHSKIFWKNTLYIVMGLLLAVPLTIVVAFLLCSADAGNGLSNMLEAIMQIAPEDVFIFIPHIIGGVLIGAGIFSCMYRSVHRDASPGFDEQACEQGLLSLRILPGPMVYATVTPICILYILYAISQMQYFLGGFTGSLSAGYTYAEYARQGFFELCAVCCINLAVISIMSFGAKLSGAQKPLAVQIYTVYLCICSLLLAGTAIAKMIMYIQVYGMTQLRIYTSWFMILLCIGFAAILLRQFLAGLPLGKIGFAAFTVMFALLSFSRPDDWMIRYNAEMYLSGNLEEFDGELLYDMSDDAWAALSCYSVEELSGNERLSDSLDARTYKAGQNFYSWQNLSSWILLYGRHGA